MNCQSCEMLAINGIPCHETGCPDAWKGSIRECRECGTDYKPGERGRLTCSPCCATSYAGGRCDCDSCRDARAGEYVESVRRNLEGCDAVSTGTCPGCEECRDSFAGFQVREFEGSEVNPEPFYSFDESAKTPGILTAYASEEEAAKASMEAFREAWSNGEVDSEASFSWQGCGICGSSLGGDREVWHYIDKQGNIRHEGDACVDCAMYLANGDIPSL